MLVGVGVLVGGIGVGVGVLLVGVGVGVLVGGIGVLVGGIGVAVAGIGVAVGAVTGYDPYPVAPTLFPEVCYSYLCAVALPRVKSTGANAIGVRLRIPVN